MKDKILLEENRCVEVFADISSQYSDPQGPFQHLTPPERKLMPGSIKPKSRYHSLFLFWAGWFSRSGKAADQAIGNVATLAKHFPNLLDPLRKMSSDELQIVREMIPFQGVERERRFQGWIKTREMLGQLYEGDPRNIFLTIDLSKHPLEMRDEVIRRIVEFYGIQHKIGQLIGQWHQEVLWETNSEFWQAFHGIPLVAVDIWWMRLVKQFDLVLKCPKDHRDIISKPISDKVSTICFDHGINHISLAQGMWSIGANYCNRNKNKFTKKGLYFCQYICPGNDHCKYIVSANAESASRGSANWEKAIKRPENSYPEPLFAPGKALLILPSKRKPEDLILQL